MATINIHYRIYIASVYKYQEIYIANINICHKIYMTNIIIHQKIYFGNYYTCHKIYMATGICIIKYIMTPINILK